MKAIWNGQVVAESADTVILEGNHHSPADSIKPEFFPDSETHPTRKSRSLDPSTGPKGPKIARIGGFDPFELPPSGTYWGCPGDTPWAFHFGGAG